MNGKLSGKTVMVARSAITAAEPSGLWGLLKESFASGTDLAKAKMDAGTNALIKAVVEDFGTSEGRSVTRDGLNSKFKGSKPAEIKDKCIEILHQAATILDAKAPGDFRPSRVGCSKPASTSPKRPKRVDFLVLAACQ